MITSVPPLEDISSADTVGDEAKFVVPSEKAPDEWVDRLVASKVPVTKAMPNGLWGCCWRRAN